MLAAFLGFYAGSGGVDGDGGIPDLDLLAGIDAHRSILTHSILAGVVAEGLLRLHTELADWRAPHSQSHLFLKIRSISESHTTEGVFDEEGDHVLLGEQLRHRRQFVGADLGPGLLHLPLHFFLLRRLPELVAPAQAVVGLEDGGR